MSRVGMIAALASGLLVPVRPQLITPQGEGTNTTAEPAKALTPHDIERITAAHDKRMRKAGIVAPPSITIAVSEMAPEKPCRFETDIGVVFFMTPAAFGELTGQGETEHAEADTESAGLIGIVNGVPVVDMDSPTERAVAVGIAISTALGKIAS